MRSAATRRGVLELLVGVRHPASQMPARPRFSAVIAMAVALPPFWSLVEAHGDELLAHARRLAGDQSAEDVLQEAFLRALRAYPRLQPRPRTCARGCTASRPRPHWTCTARAAARSSPTSRPSCPSRTASTTAASWR